MKGVDNTTARSFEALKVKLREDLDDRFSDDLIMAIVEDFLDNETLRLKSSVFKVQAISTNYQEYHATIENLNSLHAVLSRWQKGKSFEFQKKVGDLASDYENKLDSIIAVPTPYYLIFGDKEDKYGNQIEIITKRNSSFAQTNFNQPPYYFQVKIDPTVEPKNYPGPLMTEYSFYYTALLTLLKRFIENHEAGPLIGEITIPQHVAVYCLINLNIDLPKGEEQKIQDEYISINRIILDEKGRSSFARSIRRYRNEDNWTFKKISNRLMQLGRIEAFVESNYRKHLVTLEKEKNFFTDKLTEPE